MKVRNLLKKAVSKYPWMYERLLDLKYRNNPINPTGRKLPNQDTKESAEIFAEMLSRNAWGDEVSLSGAGSNLNYTRRLRADLEQFLRARSIISMLDAPCGDFVWMNEVSFPAQFDYIGGDIVSLLVDGLAQKYGSSARKFVKLDVTKDELPKVDLWLCRDCLIHLSNKDALSALRNFVRSDIKLLMTTTYDYGRVNTDISTGDFRVINLRRPPFSLPKPIEMITDYVYPFPPRRLAIWSHDQLSAWAAGRFR